MVRAAVSELIGLFAVAVFAGAAVLLGLGDLVAAGVAAVFGSDGLASGAVCGSVLVCPYTIAVSFV
jgi:hypothetical protein